MVSWRCTYSIFPVYSVEAQAPGVQGYAIIQLVTVLSRRSEIISHSGPATVPATVWVKCCPVQSITVNSHIPRKYRYTRTTFIEVPVCRTGRCLPDSPKPDSPKLRLGLGFGLGLRLGFWQIGTEPHRTVP